MPAKLYNVSFMFPGVIKMRDLEPVFHGLGDWVRYAGTSWLLWSEKSSAEVMGAIVPAIDPTDNVFITPVDMNDFIGRQPSWIWEWMRSKAPDNPVITDPSLLDALYPQLRR